MLLEEGKTLEEARVLGRQKNERWLTSDVYEARPIMLTRREPKEKVEAENAKVEVGVVATADC